MSTPGNLMDNRSILAKADLAIADLTSGSGSLQPGQAQKFMRIMIKASKMLGMVTFVPMRSPIQLIEKIVFGSRILQPGTEATALPAALRSKPDLSKETLTAKLYKGEVRLTNELLEDSIEQGTLRETIMQLMAERIALDVEEVIVNGDTASSDPFLATLDGVLKQASTNVVDCADTTTTKTHFRDMLKLMPSEFRRDKRTLKIFTSTNAEVDYTDSLANRIGDLSDRALTDDIHATYSGMDVIDIPVFPENVGTGSHCTNHLMLDPKNIHYGIWRDIRIETDKHISEGVVIIVATMRMDVRIAHKPSVVKAINVKVV